jgi:hypothetical protein
VPAASAVAHADEFCLLGTDNRLTKNARWDRALLTLELQELSVELNFDVTVTGFETAEIDLLIGELNEDSPAGADEVPDL